MITAKRNLIKHLLTNNYTFTYRDKTTDIIKLYFYTVLKAIFANHAIEPWVENKNIVSV